MNKVLPILLVCLAACQLPDVETRGALRTTGPDGILALSGHAHEYPVDSSVTLLSNLAGAAKLVSLTSDFGWGGSFPVSAFRVSSANQGILLWYCFKGGSNPQMFLALEQLDDYDPANLPTSPISSELLVPSVVFRNNFQGASDASSVRDLLGSHTGDQSEWSTLAAADVNRYILSADSLFNFVTDSQGERYNRYMFGFFSARHEAGYDNFLDRAGENGYIRYYFGYDEKDRPNRIRIILMATDSRGVNQAFARTTHEEDGCGSLQRSWPPPPDN